MRILVTGSNGQLGWELCSQGSLHGFQVIPCDLPELDITKKSEVNRVIHESKASLVVNAAAYTAVDQAESEPDSAFRVNRDGPTHLAKACQKENIPLVHISTDYVFDGSKRGAYIETDEISPIGVYGKSKAAGEEKIRTGIEEHIIVRTSWLYSTHGQNFVKTMLRLGAEREVLRVVADQHGCPTYTGDLAEAILAIAKQVGEGRPVPWGTYHYCGKGASTWHEFAEAVFQFARQYEPLAVKHVEAISTSEYPTPAKRPANSVLGCTLIEKAFGLTPKPWAQSLGVMINRYYRVQQREKDLKANVDT